MSILIALAFGWPVANFDMLTVRHRWLSFLVVTFGAICAGIGGTKNFAGVAGLRFVLGAAEAGVFPGNS
jgi:hypothetical protein